MGCAGSKSVRGDESPVQTGQLIASTNETYIKAPKPGQEHGTDSLNLVSPLEKVQRDGHETAVRGNLPELHWKTGPRDGDPDNFLANELDSIQRAACEATGAPLCLVGLFDTTNMWYRSSNGGVTPGLDRVGTFCETLYNKYRETKDPKAVFVVPNAIEDPRFASHVSVAHRPFTRFYAGVPIISAGHFLGTFAVVDFTPRDPLKPDQVQVLHKLARRTASVLRTDILERSSSGDSCTNTLPSVWIDIKTPNWRILGVNTEWERLTGVSLGDLANFPGILSVMGVDNEAELQALREAIAAVGPMADRTVSFPSIMSPFAPGGSCIQFFVALKPADRPPPVPVEMVVPPKSLKDVWVLQLHARVENVPPPQASYKPTTASAEEVQLNSASTTSAQSGPYTTVPVRFSASDPYNTVDHSSGSGGLSVISSAEDMRVPARLASLQIGSLLGKGSFGTVYAGVLRGQNVAVKIVEGVAGPKGNLQIWEAVFEALVSLQKRHANIASTIDFIKEESTGQVWIIQELCNLGTLSSQFKQDIFKNKADGSLKLRDMVETALDVARGMQYLHEQDVLHGDLSSNNVLLASANNSRGYVAKVSDFGLSRIANHDVTTNTTGTVSVMSPELLIEGKMSKAADIYSFGVCLTEMFTSKRAWEGASLGQVIFAVTVKKVKLTLPDAAPSALKELQNACVDFDSAKRPDFAEVVRRLESILADLPAP